MIEIPKFIKPRGTEQAPRWFHVAVAISMVLSASASLVAALRTSATMTALVEQNARLVRANSTPMLQYSTSSLNAAGEPELSLQVQNVGTGPARVVWFEVWLAGKPLAGPSALMRQVIAQTAPGWHPGSRITMVSSTVPATVLVAGKEVLPFRWRQPEVSDADGRRVWDALEVLRQKLEARACYCSVFDECWRTDFGAGLPQSVPRCDDAPHTSFNG